MGKKRIDGRSDSKYDLSKRPGRKSSSTRKSTRGSSKRNRDYAKESARLKVIGRRQALVELQNPDTIYMLGKSPVYIHSNQVYYKQGNITAKNLLQKDLDKIVAQVHAQIQPLCAQIDQIITNLYSGLGFSSWDEFKSWWEVKVQPSYNNFTETDKKDVIYYLALLEQFKKNATKIGAYLYMRKRQQGQKLYDEGFIRGTYIEGQQIKAGPDDPITYIRADQRKLIKELGDYLEKIMPKTGSVIDDAINNILANRDAGEVDRTFATQIGQIEEFLSSKIQGYIVDGMKISMQNVAAEKSDGKGKSKDVKSFKADTKTIFDLGTTQLEFISSDKTGMQYAFGGNLDARTAATIDRFTAGIDSDTLSLKNIQSSVNIDDIDPYADDIIGYLVRNDNAFGRKDIEGKKLVLAFFGWLKLINEIVGTDKDIVPVIRMFNRLYRTDDLLKFFLNKNGLQILTYVNQAYLEKYYDIVQGTNPEPSALYEAKKHFITESSTNEGFKLTYRALKQGILAELQTLNMAAVTNGIHTSYNILMNNIKNISS